VTPKDAQTAVLLTQEGPDPGRRFLCADDTTTIGRQADCAVCLESPAVSRHHARIVRNGDEFFVEDLGSSNGTFLNGQRTQGRQPLTEKDVLQIGPYQLVLRLQGTEDVSTDNPVIRSQVDVAPSNQSLYAQNAAQKLRVVVEIAQSLGRTLEVKPLLHKLLEQLFRLFPQADRGMVLLCQGDQYEVGAQLQRHKRASALGGPVGEAPRPGT